MPMNRHIALPSRAHDRADLPGPPRVLDVVDVEPVEAPHEEMVVMKCVIRVPEVQVIGPGPRRRLGSSELMFTLELLGFRILFLRALRRRGQAGRRRRIEEPLRLREACDELHVPSGCARIMQTGLQTDAWIA